MNKFVAPAPPMRGDEGRGVSAPLVSAIPFYSALLRVRGLIEANAQHKEALRLARGYCVELDLTGLQVALSVALVNAQKTIKEIETIAALFPQPDIDSSTLAYGESK